MKLKLLYSVSLPLLLTGCFGVTSETEGLIDKESLSSYLESSNQSINGFPYLQGLNQIGTVRFDTSTTIPTYFVTKSGSNVPSSITDSIQVMNHQLDASFGQIQVINDDLTPYRDVNFPDQNRGNGLYNEHQFKNLHNISGGIIFSIDTAFFSHQYTTNPSTMCANASIGPYDGGISISVDPSTHTFDPNTLMWVNLGNRKCSWDNGIVLHEMAHALGLFHHFDYFGKWNTTSMAVLKLLYRNPAGTPFYALQ